MNETFVVAFTTFFATIAPLDIAAVFAALTPTATSQFRRSMALRGTLIATTVLLCFAFIGDFLLVSLGISLAALRISGGILLLLLGIDMVFTRSSRAASTTDDVEPSTMQDISVFPVATPLIAGPGTMGAVILLIVSAEGELFSQAMIIIALLLVLLITLLLLLLADQVPKILGITGMHVVSRIFGILLSALAVQFMIDGVSQSGLLSGAT